MRKFLYTMLFAGASLLAMNSCGGKKHTTDFYSGVVVFTEASPFFFDYATGLRSQVADNEGLQKVTADFNELKPLDSAVYVEFRGNISGDMLTINQIELSDTARLDNRYTTVSARYMFSEALQSIELSRDYTYSLVQSYPEKEPQVIETGTWGLVDEFIVVLKPENGTERVYDVVPKVANALLLRSNKKEEIFTPYEEAPMPAPGQDKNEATHTAIDTPRNSFVK